MSSKEWKRFALPSLTNYYPLHCKPTKEAPSLLVPTSPHKVDSFHASYGDLRVFGGLQPPHRHTPFISPAAGTKLRRARVVQPLKH